MSTLGWETSYAASTLLRLPGQGIETAPFQIYITSDIEDWRVSQEGVPRESWERYTSDSFDFPRWIKIGVDDFAEVAEKMNLNKGRALYLDYIRPFSFFHFSGLQNWPEHCYTYLFNGSLVTMRPRTERIISPESPHFKEEHLLNHIDIAIFSEGRQGLEKTASELGLPLSEK